MSQHRNESAASLPTRTTKYRTDINPRNFMLKEAMAYRVGLYWAGFGFGLSFVMVAELWLHETRGYIVDFVSIAFAGFIGLLVGTAVHIISTWFILGLNYQPYEEETVEEREPKYQPTAVITHNGRTVTIEQPKHGAFVEWVQDALSDNRVYFSKNQAKDRGFAPNTIEKLRYLGILHETPNGDGVHVLTDAGRQVLREWLSS